MTTRSIAAIRQPTDFAASWAVLLAVLMTLVLGAIG